jgi:hypothetical protein
MGRVKGGLRELIGELNWTNSDNSVTAVKGELWGSAGGVDWLRLNRDN